MIVTVRYLGQLRLRAGCAEEEVTVPEHARLAEVVAALADRHDDAFRQFLSQPLLFFRGTEQIAPTSETPFHDGDVLTVLSPMAGG